MSINSLYKSCDTFVFLYPEKGKALKALKLYNERPFREPDYALTYEGAEFAIKYWQYVIDAKIYFYPPSQPIFLLAVEKNLWNVIIEDKVGWIITDCNVFSMLVPAKK